MRFPKTFLTSLAFPFLIACGTPADASVAEPGTDEMTAEDAVAAEALTAAAPKLKDGFISIRLDLAPIVRSSGEQHVVAVLVGGKVWQRKHIYFNSQNAQEAYLDWPYLKATQSYRIYAYVDANNDGLVKSEQVLTRAIVPVRGRADQQAKILINTLTKTTAGKSSLNRYGAKLSDFAVRLTVSPTFDKADAKSPWYDSARSLGIAAVRVQGAFFKNPDAAPVLGQAQTVVKVGSASAALVPNVAAHNKSFRLQWSTCAYAPRTCTQSVYLNPSRRDVDVAIPAVTFR